MSSHYLLYIDSGFPLRFMKSNFHIKLYNTHNTQLKVLMSTEGVNLSFERCQFVSSLGYFDTSSFKLDRNIRLASIRCWPLFFLSSFPPPHTHFSSQRVNTLLSSVFLLLSSIQSTSLQLCRKILSMSSCPLSLRSNEKNENQN